MNLEHFANGFKKAVADHASPNRKIEIYARNRKDDKKNGSADMLSKNGYPAKNVNDLQGSVVIESWFALWAGGYGIQDDNGNVLLGGGNPFRVNLGAPKNGNVNFPRSFPNGKPFKITIDHGITNNKINFASGVRETFKGKPGQSGYLLGLLFAYGYEAGEISQDGNGNLLAFKHDGTTPIGGGFGGLLKFKKEDD